MPSTLDATPGGVASNTYASLAEANLYFDDTLNTTDWTNASSDNQSRALLMATRILEDTVRWQGVPASSAQALSWPRRGILTQVSEDSGGVFFRRQIIKTLGGLLSPLGIELPYNEIPQFLKNATAELARSLLQGDRIVEQDSGKINSITIPGLSIGSFGGGGSSTQRSFIPPHVYQMIAFYALTVMGHTPRRVIRT